MIYMDIPKDAIKNELRLGSNKILKKYDEPYIVEDIAVLNTNYNINFLVNLRVFNSDIVKKVEKELDETFKEYGKLKVRSQQVTPCCSPKYYHISFNVTIDK